MTVSVPNDLKSVVVYPNPIRMDTTPQAGLTFSRLPGETSIVIYTLDGRQVASLAASAAQTRVTWPLTNEQGTAVASGIYLYVMKSHQSVKTGKLAILK